MAELKDRFRDFLSNIRLSSNQRQEIITAHRTLRDRLEKDEGLQQIYIETFLQGSYRRSTIIKPKNGKKSDVDVVVVTRVDRNKVSPSEAIALFKPFMDKHYKGKWTPQGRSIGITLSYAEMDLVITSAPSEVAEKAMRSAAVKTDLTVEDLDEWYLNEFWVSPDSFKGRSDLGRSLRKAASSPQWKTEPLWIPDRDAGIWEETNPLEQIRWTFEKNKETNKHFVNVVKALKWWRRVHYPDDRPKGYPFEHLLGDCCPLGIESVGVGVAETLETMVDKYQVNVDLGQTPESSDRGTAENVMKRITPSEFATFFEQVKEAVGIARRALDAEDPESTEAWRELFGSEFPEGPSGSGARNLSSGGFNLPEAASEPRGGRFG